MTITVHHLENSRSQRILWLLEELDLEYKVKRYQRDPKTMLAPPELRKVHPLGKSPVVTDGDRVLAESGLIVAWLGETFASGTLMPATGTAEHLRCRYWLHYAEGSAMPPLLLKLVFQRVESAPMPFFVRPVARMISKRTNADFIDPQLKLHMDYLESELTDNDAWFVGNALSVADIQLSFPIEAMAARGGLNARHPRLQSWLQRIHARSAYQRALERGGPYQLG